MTGVGARLKRVEPLNKLLESQYGLKMDLTDVDHLVAVCNHYDGKRDLLLRTLGEADALADPEYAKAVLISETARLVIREIAPRRLRRKKR